MINYLISPKNLYSIVKTSKKDLLILDARSREEYNHGHIPGSVHIAWEEWNEIAPEKSKSIIKTPGYWGKLADFRKAKFEEKLGNLGVSHDCKIVVYGNGKWSKGKEGRITWMLVYLGHENVVMLDGGLKGWKELNLPITGDEPTIVRSKFTVNLKPERRLMHHELVDKLGTKEFPTMLDTRSKLEFLGKVFWYQPDKGRIPDSHLIIYNDIFTPDGKFISKETYKTYLPPGYEKTSNVGTYCEVGVRTCTVALLHEQYTGQVLPVYDGSIMEWSSHKELPLLRK